MIDITDIKVVPKPGPHGFLARASFVIAGCFVVRDVRIVNRDGRIIVAFPSRDVTDECPECGRRNPLRDRYCGQCGRPLKGDRVGRLSDGATVRRKADGRPTLYIDVAHPADSRSRHEIETVILKAYLQAVSDSSASV